MKQTVSLFFLLFPVILFGQVTYKGIVLDSVSKNPLPFVNIRVENSLNGFTTDIDGAFYYNSKTKISFFEFNYLGYGKQQFILKVNESNIVFLASNSIGLKEVIIDADYNPAIPIIKKVIENRKRNNPEKNLNYTYESYNKLIMNVEYDSLKAASMDSSMIKMQRFLAKQDLMLVESVVATYHKAPNQTKDIVTASRTSGLKNVMLPLLATELQSFSFYNAFFTLSDVQYISPITSEGFSKYSYELLDEYVEDKDTVFVISFSPKKGKTFDSMKGVLYLSSFKYGIKNVIAKPVSSNDLAEIQINQKYQLIDGSWFPEQLNSNIIMNNIMLEGMDMVGNSTSYLKNINLNPSEDSLRFNSIALEIDVDENQNDETLSEARYKPLTTRDSLTYKAIDSIGKEMNLDRKLQAMESLIEGRVPIGIVDLDVNKSLGYSEYEGFRLGAGLYTNSRLSKRLSIGGYFAYGFKDKKWKYGGEVDVKLFPKKGIGINVLYSEDISLAGDIAVGENKKFGNNQDLYRVYTSLYDEAIDWTLKFRFRIKGVKVKLVGKLQRLTPFYDYSFLKPSGDNVLFQTNSFDYSFVGVEASYSPYSRVMYNGFKLVELSAKYPVFNVSYLQTLSFYSSNKISRVLFKVTDNFSLPFFGKSNYSFVAGAVSGDVPFLYLFNQQGTKENFNISVFESFETMIPNEFFASAFMNVFWEQNFGTMIKKGFFQPELALYQGVGFGNSVDKNLHLNVNGKSMEKGYYESGLKIHNIIHSGASGFGMGVFYRYGPYSLPNQQDNFTYKITISIGL